MPNFRELEIPATLVAEEEEGFEVVRFWIGGGNDHISLSLPSTDQGSADVAVWGKIAADIIKHAVRALNQDDASLDADNTIAAIERAFYERLKEVTNFQGQLTGKIQ